MKTIQLTIKNFIRFSELAKRIQLIFMYQRVGNDTIEVEADASTLSELGY